MNNIEELHSIGQSLWYDNIQRSILENGSLQKMIDQRIVLGVTSNPSIFQKAIANSTDYDSVLKPMAWSGMDAESIFWQLAIEDIQKTADLLYPVYEQTGRKDGYVSLEVNPFLANDTDATVREAQQLWMRVNRPNLMIKIPATKEGVPAIRNAIAAGLNINVTLIFSISRYEEVVDAYLSGLEDRIKTGEKVDRIASVASFFVSRVDTKVDRALVSLYGKSHHELAGKAAVANAKLAYEKFLQIFSSDRFLKLKGAGAQVQRPLWASTSTKNPNYRDVIYVEDLIGKDTVNTVPPATLDAFIDHGKVGETIGTKLESAQMLFDKLRKAGISMGTATSELELEGVQAFSDAYRGLLQSVETRRQTAVNELGSLASQVKQRVRQMSDDKLVERIFQHDASLWTNDPDGQKEICQRMDWLEAPVKSMVLVEKINELPAECKKLGFTHALLLGMGGSSLAPEVISLVIGRQDGKGNRGLELKILDSTDPDQVQAARNAAPIENTVFIVASKSGSTGEINAFFDYFWEETRKVCGENVGDHFIAITDPGTKLEKLAHERGFWKVFSADPLVGGRNSALTTFGLVPAAILGIDIPAFLKSAKTAMERYLPTSPVNTNFAAVLGAIIAEGAFARMDKLTVITDGTWFAFPSWLEQLVAESSGKNGKGIIPISNEPIAIIENYGNDRLFVYIRSTGEKDEFCALLLGAGHPVLRIDVTSHSGLADQFFTWEFATAVACSVIGVNSFNQPDVQDAKTRTLESIKRYKEEGKFKDFPVSAEVDGTKLFVAGKMAVPGDDSLYGTIVEYVNSNIGPGDYIAINAFLPRNEINEEIFNGLRSKLLDKFKHATTLGFGPRFLHSTGQLHKGGPNKGIFLLITARRSFDVEIPGEGVSFGVMQRAQAIGDIEALLAKDRRVLWIDLPSNDPTLLIL